MNLLKGLLTLCLFSSMVAWGQTAEEKKMMDEMYEESFKTLSEGMTADQKAKLRESMEQAKQLHGAHMRKSPEERKKIEEESQRRLNSPESQKQMQAEFENMGPEEKEMLKKASENLSKSIEKLKK